MAKKNGTAKPHEVKSIVARARREQWIDSGRFEQLIGQRAGGASLTEACRAAGFTRAHIGGLSNLAWAFATEATKERRRKAGKPDYICSVGLKGIEKPLLERWGDVHCSGWKAKPTPAAPADAEGPAGGEALARIERKLDMLIEAWGLGEEAD